MTELIGMSPYKGVNIYAYCGNICQMNSDAVVISTDPQLSLNVGTARSVSRLSGRQLWDVTSRFDSHESVLVVDSSEFTNFPFKRVIVVPIRDRHRNRMSIVYRQVLRAAIDANVQSVSMSLIGAGAFGLDFRTCATQFFEVLTTFTTFGSINTINVVDLNRSNIAIFFRFYQAFSIVLDQVPQDNASNLEVLYEHIVVPEDAENSNVQPLRGNGDDGVQILGDHVPMPIPANLDVMIVPTTSSSSETKFSKAVENCLYSEIDRNTLREAEDFQAVVPCSICLNDLITSCGEEEEGKPLTDDPVVQLKLCPHTFHKSCINNCFMRKKQCPLCMKWYERQLGTQPEGGTMRVKRIPGHPPGHPEADGWLKIYYTIPSGIQTSAHIRPGYPFSGTTRSAFLPNDEGGREILRLLQRAFELRHIFTVSDSVTSGRMNVPVWVIHHKTNTTGGPDMYGYPDPGYYDRVKAELAALDITVDTLND